MANPNELESIVQKMIDADESEESIASVIKEYNTPKGDTYKGPDTFWGGVGNSLKFGGEVENVVDRSLTSYGEGATDIIPNIIGAIGSIGNAIANPREIIPSVVEGVKGMGNTAKYAGSDPESFGRMMGQMTGQPLITKGVGAAAPKIGQAMKPAAGAVLENAGKIGERFAPLSGLLPKWMHGTSLGPMERALGTKLKNAGQNMRTKTKQGVVVPEPKPKFTEGEIIPEQGLSTQGPLPGPIEPLSAGQTPLGLPTPPQPGLPVGYQTSLPAGRPTRFNMEGPNRKRLGPGDPLRTPLSSADKASSPSRGAQAFDQQYRRYNQLLDKSKKGKLTPDELIEGQQLNKTLGNFRRPAAGGPDRAPIAPRPIANPEHLSEYIKGQNTDKLFSGFRKRYEDGWGSGN